MIVQLSEGEFNEVLEVGLRTFIKSILDHSTLEPLGQDPDYGFHEIRIERSPKENG